MGSTLIDREYVGCHYETGTVTNLMAAEGIVAPHTGKPVSEALAFGASGGIAFGYFVFEYKGMLPHVALLARNTFDPFERCLDGLGVVRELRTSTDSDRAEGLLRDALDDGRSVVVWADAFSMPYTGLTRSQMMWVMCPLLVVGYEGDVFWIVDGSARAFSVEAAVLKAARGRVKKDRNRFMVLERVDEGLLREGVRRELKSMTKLYLEKPPAGSPKNFGRSGLAHFREMLVNDSIQDGWGKKFEVGPRFYQAVAGTIGQPGVFDWIETWGTGPGADRGVYADFLDETALLLDIAELGSVSGALRESAGLWTQLAELALPSDVDHFRELKALKREGLRLRRSGEDRVEILDQLRSMPLIAEEPGLIDGRRCRQIRDEMAEVVGQIQSVEVPAIEEIVSLLLAVK